MSAKKTSMPREPQVGDAYFPLFESDYGDSPSDLPSTHLTITAVEPYGDNASCYCVTAVDDDGNRCGYDCMWSDKLQAWDYNSNG